MGSHWASENSLIVDVSHPFVCPVCKEDAAPAFPSRALVNFLYEHIHKSKFPLECPDCGLKSRMQDLGLHMLRCGKDVVLCPACRIEIQRCDLDEHIRMGCISFPCRICSKKCCLAQMKEHVNCHLFCRSLTPLIESMAAKISMSKEKMSEFEASAITQPIRVKAIFELMSQLFLYPHAPYDHWTELVPLVQAKLNSMLPKEALPVDKADKIMRREVLSLWCNLGFDTVAEQKWPPGVFASDVLPPGAIVASTAIPPLDVGISFSTVRSMQERIRSALQDNESEDESEEHEDATELLPRV